jgi:hypothetical protein
MADPWRQFSPEERARAEASIRRLGETLVALQKLFPQTPVFQLLRIDEAAIDIARRAKATEQETS